MTSHATVSVITPCFNGAPYLRATLESAARQTSPPLEILVIDDGSTDDSNAIADSFGPPVRVLRQANQGESVARNAGLAEARGDYILFLDADDLLHPEAIERQLATVRDVPGGVACMGGLNFTDDPKTPTATYLPAAKEFFPTILQTNLNPVHCWLAPRKTLLDVGAFQSELTYFEDWDLWWRVGLSGAPLVTSEFYGAFYRQHAASQLATTPRADRALGHVHLVQRMGHALLQRPAILDAHGETLFWSCAAALRRAREAGVAWSELEPLARTLRSIARHGPARVTASRYGTSIRWFGTRLAEWLSNFQLASRLSNWLPPATVRSVSHG